MSEILENILGFGDNCVWIGCLKHLLLSRENTCHHESRMYQIVSKFQILLRQNFSNWSYFGVMEKYV